MGGDTIKVGTRGSRLALIQTELVIERLRAAHPGVTCEIVIIHTQSDRDQQRPISHFGDKGVFVRVIEEHLLDGRIDLAVHSLKDVPADVAVPGLELVAYAPREDPHDALLSRSGGALMQLPSSARVGTSSPRRRAQLLAARPDVTVEDIRGNVDTRLRKLREGEYDAIIVAAAGLIRLGLQEAITEYLSYEQFLPDAGQGIITVQGRSGDAVATMAAAADDPDARIAATAERAVVRALEATCRTPTGALAAVHDGRLLVQGVAERRDGSGLQRAEAEGPTDRAQEVGERVGRELLAQIGA